MEGKLMRKRSVFRTPRYIGLSLAWTAAMLVAPAAPMAAAADVSTCFGQVPTVTDNGPGDLDSRTGYIRTDDFNAVVLGTSGNDVIDITGGTTQSLRVCGGEGDDIITVTGSSLGSPLIDGGPGNDTLVCSGPVACSGSEGNDVLYCSGAFVQCDGGPGNDRIIASSVVILGSLMGGDGNDVITGTSARSVIDGGPGDDTITGSGSAA